MDFDKISKGTALLDTIGSIAIGGLIVFAWLTVDKPIQYIYTPLDNGDTSEVIIINNASNSSTDSNTIVERQEGLEGCVITWCLTILLVLCAWRIISSAILALASQTRSLGLFQYWMGHKCLVLMMSTFILVPAFTVTKIIPSAAASFVLDLVTSCFTRFLIPEMETISRGSARKNCGNSNKAIL